MNSKSLALLGTFSFIGTMAIANSTNSSINQYQDSESQLVNASASSNTQSQSQSQILRGYSGNVGTGVRRTTISSTGAAFEFTPSGTNFYGFFGQTLGNGFYYELRGYTKYNYQTSQPIATVPVSSQTDPMGYGVAVKLGYDFQPTPLIDIIPYLRLQNYYNMGTVYTDNTGNAINSVTYAILPGMKIAYKVTPQFNPYIDLYGGWQQMNLTGNFNNTTTPGSTAGTVNQTTLTYEIGFSSKLTDNLALIPYMQYITTANSPDATSSTAISQGGFNVSSLTGTQQVFGLKLNYSW